MSTDAPPSFLAAMRARPRFFLALFIAVWLSYIVHFNPNATGSDRFVILTLALVEGPTLSIDVYRGMTTELAYSEGHAYLDTNPGMSFLAVPAWAFLRCFMGPPPHGVAPPTSPHFFAAHLVGLSTTTAVAGALTSVLIAFVLLQLTGKTSQALTGAALYAFGSIAFFFSTRLQQNVVIACFAVVTWVLFREYPGTPPWRVLAAIGFLLGFGLFVDLSIVPLALAVLFALARERLLARSLLPLILGAVGPLACLLIYQQAAFGHPLWPAQAYIVRANSVLEPGILGLTFPSPGRLLHQLVSLDCGLFAFMPWVALAFLPSRSRTGLHLFSSRERSLLGATCLFYLLWVSILPSFRYCLFGPRYLLPIVPFLACAAVLKLKSWPRLGFITIAAGFLINLAGAQIGVPTNNMVKTLAVYVLRGPWFPVVDWIRANWLAGPEIVTPYGLLLLWVAALVTLWHLGSSKEWHST